MKDCLKTLDLDKKVFIVNDKRKKKKKVYYQLSHFSLEIGG